MCKFIRKKNKSFLKLLIFCYYAQKKEIIRLNKSLSVVLPGLEPGFTA